MRTHGVATPRKARSVPVLLLSGLLVLLPLLALSPAGASAPTTVPIGGPTIPLHQWGPAHGIDLVLGDEPMVVGGPSERWLLWHDGGVAGQRLDASGAAQGPSLLLVGTPVSAADATVLANGHLLVATVEGTTLHVTSFTSSGIPDDNARTIASASGGLLDVAVAAQPDGGALIIHIERSNGATAVVAQHLAVTTLFPTGYGQVATDLGGVPSELALWALPSGGAVIAVSGDGVGALLRLDGMGARIEPPLLLPSIAQRQVVLTADGPLSDPVVDLAYRSGGNIFVLDGSTFGAPAGTPQRVTPIAHAVSGPVLLRTADGERLVLWGDDRGDSAAVYAAWSHLQDNNLFLFDDRAPLVLLGAPDGADRMSLVYGDGTGTSARTASSYHTTLQASPQGEGATIHPGEHLVLPLALTNDGGAAQQLTLSPSLPQQLLDEGWTISVEPPVLALGDSAVGTVSLTIDAPTSGGVDGQVVPWGLEVSGGGGVDRTEGSITLEVVRKVTLTTDRPLVALVRGVPTHLVAQVHNDGDAASVIGLEASMLDGLPHGWSMGALPPSVELRGLQGSILDLTLTAATDAPEGAQVSVLLRATDVAEPTVGDTLEVHAVVVSDVRLQLDPFADIMTIAPGQTAQVPLELRNVGLDQGAVLVSLEVLSAQGEWDASIPQSDLVLGPGATAEVLLQVSAPTDAHAGERFVVRVRAQAPSGGAETTVTLIASHVAALRIEGPDAPIAALPAVPVEVPLRLTNTGNGLETLRVRPVAMPPGWQMDILDAAGDDQSATAMPLAAGASLTVRMQLTPPADARVDDVDLTVEVIDGVRVLVPLQVRVGLVSALQMVPSQSRIEADLYGATLQMLLRNGGNGPDAVRLEVPNLPSGWHVELPEADADGLLPLQPGEERLVSLVLHWDGVGLPLGESNRLDVRATAADGRQLLRSILLDLLLPDLVIGTLQFSSDPTVPDRSITVTAVVANDGTGPAREVVVTLRDNGERVGELSFGVISRGHSASATFTWVPRVGEHVLLVTADEPGTIFEVSDSNNAHAQRISVRATVAPTPVPPTLTVLAIVTTGSVLGLAAAGIASEGLRIKILGVLLVPLYSKIRRDGVLDHFVRGQVYGYIKANPGEHYNAVKKALELKNGTLVYHLQTLEREEYIQSVHDGRFRRFYPIGMRIPEADKVQLNHIQEAIRELVLSRPGISQKELAQEVGLSGATINYHIARMRKLAVIRMTKVGRQTQLFVDAETEQGPATAVGSEAP